MPGGRFASAIVGPYEAVKVWTNCCNSAASVTIAGAGLNQTVSPTFSINISNTNVCIACNTTYSSNTYDYSNMVTVLSTNTNVCDGIVCVSSTQCCCFRIATYVSNTSASNSVASFECWQTPKTYYYPVPYPHEAVYTKSDVCASRAYALVPSGCYTTWPLIQITSCYCGSGGSLPASCFYCGAVVSQLTTSYIAASCCASTLGNFGYSAYVSSYAGYPNLQAIDYWSRSKPGYTVTACGCVFVSWLCDAITCYFCPMCCTYASKTASCTPSDGASTCSYNDFNCLVYFGCAGTPTDICSYMMRNANYQCLDTFYAQKIVLAGCSMYGYQNPVCGIVSLRAHCFQSPNPCGLYSPTVWSSGNRGVMLFHGVDNFAPIKWLTYNHLSGSNMFMLFNCNTPDWNGIWNISSGCLYNCLALATRCVNCCVCVIYPAALTGFATKLGNIPTAWCSIGSKNLTITTPVAGSVTEFVAFAGDLSVGGLTGCLTRYTSPDLVNWSATDKNFYGSYQNPTSAIVGNTTTIYRTVSNYETCLTANGVLETCTSAKNIERTGIVTSNGDTIHVRNHSAIPMAVSIWGYTES